ncbi:carbamoyl phosphate synthase large subunit [Lactobacillus sp.]|uniref:carbamoyl phosphate synthase large subunit n=1 Tax=Lactobacillus sp. TaxID=1591 RepID=UPI003EF76819
MPRENELNKILIIGSGSSLAGNVANTDLLTKSAIQALIEENIQVVLVNPNPASVSTDPVPGLTVYLEPMTLDFLKRILRMEEPDAIMTAFGSLTALNVTKKLQADGILHQMGIRILGTNDLGIAMANPQKRAHFLANHHLPISQSWTLDGLALKNDEHLQEQLDNKLDFPILLTKKFLFERNQHISFKTSFDLAKYLRSEFKDKDFHSSDYRMSEDLSSCEEVIIDLIRDEAGNIAFVGATGSLEPVGIDSGDSVLIKPLLTVNNDQMQVLRKDCRQIAEALKLVGFLSVHFAISHHEAQMHRKVLAVKARITKTAIFDQKTSLYSIGYILAKVAIGYHLNEITDPATDLCAAIEPVWDAVSIKIPYWSFSKTGYNHYQLGKRTQSTGEAVGIGRNFESAFFKALISSNDLEVMWNAFIKERSKSEEEILDDLAHPTELHLIQLLAALSEDIDYQKISAVFNIHPVYFQKLKYLVKIAHDIAHAKELDHDLLMKAKIRGFSSDLLAKLTQMDVHDIFPLLAEKQVHPGFLAIDNSAGVYQPKVKVYYQGYGTENELKLDQAKKKVLVLGMPPFQVSVTSEFDYMLYHALEALKEEGYETVLLSNNDESASMDYSLVDRVYFEPINLDSIITICEEERITDVVTQFSGKQVSALRVPLMSHGLKIFGQHDISKLLPISHLDTSKVSDVKRVPYLASSDYQAVLSFAEKVGYPVLVGGYHQKNKQKAAVVYDLPALEKYYRENQVDHFTISQFITGTKYEITAITDGTDVTIPGIVEHLEQSGSHASDSIAVFGPQYLAKKQGEKLKEETIKLIRSFKIRGIFNLHFLIRDNEIYLLQIKTYAGHNLAFLSKSMKKDLVKYAVKVLAGQQIKDLGYPNEVWPVDELIHVKMPVFSYLNYSSDNTFDSKMKSFDAVMGRDKQLAKALYKGYEASDLHIPSYGTIFFSVSDEEKNEVANLAKRFARLGFKITATEGTANILAEAGITTGVIAKIQEGSRNLLERIRSHRIVMVVNVVNLSDSAVEDSIKIKDQALNTHIPVFSSLETVQLILDVLESLALTTQPI